MTSKLLQLTNQDDWKESQSWCWIVTRNTCKRLFYGDARVITWLKNSLEKLGNEFHVKVKKCVKQKYVGCPLLKGKFYPKYLRGAQKSVRYNKYPL